jgi:hypothetical protein
VFVMGGGCTPAFVMSAAFFFRDAWPVDLE